MIKTVDTDVACEADDQYAIVHALLTPRFDVKGIIAEQFLCDNREQSVNKSYAEIEKILDLMEINNVPVFRGAYSNLKWIINARVEKTLLQRYNSI